MRQDSGFDQSSGFEEDDRADTYRDREQEYGRGGALRPSAPQYPYRKQRRQRPHPLSLAAIAIVAAALGIAGALVFLKGPTSSGTASPGYTPSAAAPGNSGQTGGLGALPPLSGGGQGKLMLMLSGRVTAKAGSTITISGNGPSVTATVTSSTRFIGQVKSLSDIKVGDQISAQVSGTGPSHMVASEIQDPGQAP